MTSATSTLTTATFTTALDVGGSSGEVFCSQQVIDAVFLEDFTETSRLILLNENVDCTVFWRGLLWLALELQRPKVSLHLVQNYSYRSWQLYVQNETTKLTPLLMAAELGYTDVVEEIFVKTARGLAPMMQDDKGNTALHLASRWPDTVARLLQIAPDPTEYLAAVNLAGDQALHLALRHGNGIAAKAMIDNSEQRAGTPFTSTLVSTPDGRGNFPVHLTGDFALLQLLVESGARLDTHNSVGALPLHTVAAFGGSASSGALGLAAAVVNISDVIGGSIDVRDTAGRTALHYAARGGFAENVRWLIDHGANTGAVDEDGRLALSLGLSNGHSHIVDAFRTGSSPPLIAVVDVRSVEMLRFVVLNHSMPADALDPATGRGAVFHAAETGQDGMVEFFLAQGVDVDSIDKLGYAGSCVASTGTTTGLLQCPKHSGHVQRGGVVLEVAREILRWRHGEVDAGTAKGNTPLHLAALQGNTGVVGLLLQWCSNAQARNTAELLPSDFATDRDVAMLIRDASFSQNRCQCDCGPYDVGPLFLSLSWRGGCMATVKCELNGYDSATEQLQCEPQPIQSNSTIVMSAWAPPVPRLHCVGSTSSALTDARLAWTLGFALVPALWYLEQ